MKAKHFVPRPARPLARRTYRRLEQRTARWRMTPAFIVIGGQRCGTTSIFKSLAEHPQVLAPPVDKGTDYYTMHYSRGLDWYRGHFPLRRTGAARDSDLGPAVAFEACTYYMFHPYAIERLARDFPDIKLVAMLRDPVERAFSAYKHELARGYETETDFRQALELEDERVAGEAERLRDPDHHSFAYRHHAYRRRGQFAEQLERVFDHYPSEQVHVMRSEDFFTDPAAEFRTLSDFLGLGRFEPTAFEQHNARPSKPMPSDAQAFLEEHYAPHEQRLAALLGGRLSRFGSSGSAAS
jgi:Sulfotransferase domain